MMESKRFFLVVHMAIRNPSKKLHDQKKASAIFRKKNRTYSAVSSQAPVVVSNVSWLPDEQ